LGRSVPVVCGMVSHLLPKYFHEQKYTFGFLWPPSKGSDKKVLNFCLLPSSKMKKGDLADDTAAYCPLAAVK